MANALYPKGRESLLNGNINWISDNIKAVLVDTDVYSPSLSSDEFLSDIPVGARVSTSLSLTTKTATGGVADAADITFSVVSGAEAEAIVLFKDTGTEGSSRLLAYIDTATGLPVTPDGGHITVEWSTGANRIFAI